MAIEEATAVNEEVVDQETTATESAPVEKETTDDPLLSALSSDDDDVTQTNKPATDAEEESEDTDEADDTADSDKAEETDAEEGEDKQLSPKSENRFQKLANENRSLKAEIERINSQIYKPQTVDELIEEGVSPALAEVRSLKQELEIQNYTNEIVEAQTNLSNESARVLNDFTIFNPDHEDFQEDLAAQAADALRQSLIIDPNTKQIVGSHLSPYQIYKPIADAYTRSLQVGKMQGQKSTEKMMSNADTPPSRTPKQKKVDPLLEVLASDD